MQTRLKNEAKVEAILSLQSEDCLSALAIDLEGIKRQCVEEGIMFARLPMRDFDKEDQATMLPDAVRHVAALAATGRRVYVHCTAGINRAPLTVVGYLAFVRGWNANDALKAVKAARPAANPYMESLYTAKARMLHGRNDELTAVSRQLYEERSAKGQQNNGRNDWFDAEDQLIKRLFDRRAKADAELAGSMEAVMVRHGSIKRGPTEEEIRLTNLLNKTRKAAAEADEQASAEFARAQAEFTGQLAAAQKMGADAVAAAQARHAAELARAQKEASDAALAAAAALDAANASAAAALSAAAEEAAAELDAAAAEAQAAAEVAARQIRAALDAADVQAKASAARQAVLENEVRRLSDAAAAALRFDTESAKTKSDMEMSAVQMAKDAAQEVQRMRGQVEDLKRQLADMQMQLQAAQMEVVLLQGVAPQSAAAAALAAVAASPLPGTPAHTGSSNGKAAAKTAAA